MLASGSIRGDNKQAHFVPPARYGAIDSPIVHMCAERRAGSVNVSPSFEKDDPTSIHF